ncbi:MAG TPA: peptidylprolyl isomerase [Blastocatellia bacterium]|jgi:cyclophilin family peptidyl-prolyl cis-trans isomerase
MKLKAISCLLLIAAFIGQLACSPDPGSPDEVAVLETSYGRIVIEFLPDKAPRHVANFKQLAREGFYDGIKIHHLAKNQSMPIAFQTGDPNTKAGDKSTWGHGQADQPRVPGEISRDLSHVRGMVSAPIYGKDIDSGTSQFIIVLNANPQWDSVYSIFGRVIEGLHVADAIGGAPTEPKTTIPLDPVELKRVYITTKSEIK